MKLKEKPLRKLYSVDEVVVSASIVFVSIVSVVVSLEVVAVNSPAVVMVVVVFVGVAVVAVAVVGVVMAVARDGVGKASKSMLRGGDGSVLNLSCGQLSTSLSLRAF